MLYYKKYIKYKTKYLNLKGGTIPEINCDLLPFEKNDINIIYQGQFILQNNEDSDKNYLLNDKYQFEKTNIKINKPIFNILDISMLANLTVKLGSDLIPYHIGSLQQNFNIIIGLLQYLQYINDSIIKKKDKFTGELNDFRTYISSKIFNIKENNFIGISQINSILNCFSFFNKLHELLNYVLLNDPKKETINPIFPNIENIKDFYNIYNFFYDKNKETTIERHKDITINKYLQSNIDDYKFYDDINKLKKFINICIIIDEKIQFKLIFKISLINLILINWIYLRNINKKLIIGSLSKNLYPISSINFLQNIFQKNENEIYEYAEEIKKLKIEDNINIFLLNKINIPLNSNSLSVRNGISFTTCVENAMLQLLKIILWENNQYNIELLPDSVTEPIKNILRKINNESTKKETEQIMDEFVELLSKDPNIHYRINDSYNIISDINNVGNILNLIFKGFTKAGGISDYNVIFEDINETFQDYYNLQQKNSNIEIKKNKINFLFNIVIREGHSYVVDNDENMYKYINNYEYLNIIYILFYNRDENIIYSSDFRCFYDMEPTIIQNFLFIKIIDILKILLIECNNSTDARGNTCLHIACLLNNEDKLREYINKNYADINYVNNRNETPLLYDIKNSNERCVRLLIENKADVNIDNSNETPLFTSLNNLNYVKLLLDNNCDINYISKNGNSAIQLASRMGNLESVKLLIERCADINNFGKLSPFLGACESGNHDCVQLYIDKGINIYQVNQDNDTALSLVSGSGDCKSLEFFINKCLDVNNVNIFGKTPIILACSKKNNFNFINLLIKNGADVNAVDNEGYTSLLNASLYGYFEYIKLLLDNGASASINKANNYGETSIYYASLHGFLDCMKILLEYGADIKIFNQKQRDKNPLIKVIDNNNLECFELLIDYTDNYYEEILLLLCSKGRFELIDILMKKKCIDINKNIKNYIPLIFVSSISNDNSYCECIEVLINHGADVNILDSYKNTALIISSRGGFHKIVKLLINKGALLNLQNEAGDTALIIASKFGLLKCVDLLIKHNADINIRNNTNKTALMIASENCDIKCIELLQKN